GQRPACTRVAVGGPRVEARAVDGHVRELLRHEVARDCRDDEDDDEPQEEREHPHHDSPPVTVARRYGGFLLSSSISLHVGGFAPPTSRESSMFPALRACVSLAERCIVGTTVGTPGGPDASRHATRTGASRAPSSAGSTS